jgi:SAM-dependent methyltransferase
MSTTETEIEAFWETHPCGDSLIGGLSSYRDLDEFLAAYDRFRYSTESHIPHCLDRIDFAGKRVLEIGLGQGSESEQMIRRGARWSGIDLTRESIDRVRQRLALRGLPYDELRQGSVLALPFPERRFDVVFSHGVLHHVPDIGRAQHEIHRVLEPGGELVAMLYARWSLNYVLSISLLRRAGLLALHALGMRPGGKYGEHLARAREMGVLEYLRMRNFLHRNTDGPSNPYSRVYDVRGVRRAFPCFRVMRAYKRFMHAPPLPVRGLPFERLLGWHLWVHLRPR